MESLVGVDKFPLLEFEDNKYTHLFPVTKYQFERYIWTAKNASDIDYNRILGANHRISPHEVNEMNIKNLFITNISYNEALKYAEWMGGRLPVRGEIEVIYNNLSSTKVKDILNNMINLKDIDKRCPIALARILSILPDVKLIDIIENSDVGDLCSTTTFEPYKPIYTKQKYGWPQLVGKDACNARIENAAFRVIIDNI